MPEVKHLFIMSHFHNHDGALYLSSPFKRLLFFFCQNLRFFAFVASAGLVLAIVSRYTHITLYHPLIHQAVSDAGVDTMRPADEFKMQITLYVFYLVFLFILILVMLALIAGSSSIGRWPKYFIVKKLAAVFSIYNKIMVLIYRQFSPKKWWVVNTSMVEEL
jgi:hypothetical protein